MLVSGVQQSDSYIYIFIYVYASILMWIYITHNICVYIYIYVHFQILSHVGYYNTLYIVPCAIQEDFAVYLFYI